MSIRTTKEAVEYIITTDKLMISATTAAKAIGMDPVALRFKAKDHPEMLPFPVMVVGRNVKIPKIPFMELYGLTKKEK